MDPITFAQLNEAYHNGVYGQEEILDIQEWVEALIDEGYDLDQYSDDELYEAYLADSKNYQNLSGKRLSRVMRKAAELAARKEMFRHPDVIAQAQRRGVTRKEIKDSENEYDERSDKIITRIGEHDPEKVKARETQNRKTINVRATPVSGPALAEELDLYDLVSEYLVSKGFCDSYEDADVIMANMSEEWRDNILDEATVLSVTSPGGKKRTLNITKAKPARNLSGSEWHDAAKTSRDLKKQREASSFSPQAERAARTRGQEQVSRNRQSDRNMRIRFTTSALQRRFGIPDSALDPEDRSKDIPKRSVSLREDLDLYDLVSEYLVSEGFCDSYEDADVIMANMSEEWREGILDEVTGGGQIRFRKGLPGKSPKKSGMVATPQQKAALKLGKMDVDPKTDPKRRERQARVALR